MDDGRRRTALVAWLTNDLPERFRPALCPGYRPARPQRPRLDHVTANPTAEWVARQITEAFPWDEAPHYMIRDRDRIDGAVVTRRLRAMGIRARTWLWTRMLPLSRTVMRAGRILLPPGPRRIASRICPDLISDRHKAHRRTRGGARRTQAKAGPGLALRDALRPQASPAAWPASRPTSAARFNFRSRWRSPAR